jgi:hypothetical protein
MITIYLRSLGQSRNDAKEHLYKITSIEGDVRVYALDEWARVGDVISEKKARNLLDQKVSIITT